MLKTSSLAKLNIDIAAIIHVHVKDHTQYGNKFHTKSSQVNLPKVRPSR